MLPAIDSGSRRLPTPPLTESVRLEQPQMPTFSLVESTISLPPIDRRGPEDKTEQDSSMPTLPLLKGSFSAPTLSRPRPKKSRSDIYGKRWAPERKQYLHYHKERRWLELKAKQQHVNFTPKERRELRKCFDALAGKTGVVTLEQIEDMLISFGIANSRDEVAKLVAKVDDLNAGELSFEQFLELVFARKDMNMVKVFQDIIEGNLGDCNLNFLTLLSENRRRHFINASGAREVDSDQQMVACKVLQNFSDLRRGRISRAIVRDPQAEALGIYQKRPPSAEVPNFEAKGSIPMGSLSAIWRGICSDRDLLSHEAQNEHWASRHRQSKP
eukprot:TRINITY_DN28602_c0_g1_i1.p1 TRINITY_DN28602_c0_g1~~TRINITY_DN28602_c0_g1_i1.p1  ORF type:complete len:328 (-),score=61.86 TRINITY_DN28602_c0_g1_i1:76-1059(-)